MKRNATHPGMPLAVPQALDKALKDLMPMIDNMINAAQAKAHGDDGRAAALTVLALANLAAIDPRSPALKCYQAWTAQKLNAQDAARG